MPANFFDQRKKFAGCDSKIELFGFEVTLGHDHEIQSWRQKGLMQPETFPEHPLDAIPHDCRSDLLGDGHPDAPRFVGRTKAYKHHEVLGKKSATLIITEREVGSPEQSMPTGPG